MNYGRFFALDMEASRLEDGIAVFNYTWLRDEKANIGDVKISPEFPIFVSITPSFVRFVLQYCTYKQPSNNTLPFSFSPHRAGKTSSIIHMESMLLELPLTASSGPGLAATIKRIYNTPFPINLGDNENYIQYLLERSLSSTGINNVTSSILKVDGIDYSSLPTWNMVVEDEKNEDRNDKSKYYKLYETEDETKPRYYNKFLRKLFLDFLFDVMHSDVFHNSAHYNQMYGALMSDFFCSSIIKKAEFYYQRALVNDIYKNDASLPFKKYDVIYAEALDLAERNWLGCIQSPLADKHFVFTPNWYESQNSYDNDPDKISHYTWFADPEKELRGVFNGEKSAVDTQGVNSSRDLFKKSKNATDTTSLDISLDDSRLQLRQEATIKWLLRRYDFDDALQLGFFRCANWVLWGLLGFVIVIVLAQAYDLLIWLVGIMMPAMLVLGLLVVLWRKRKVLKGSFWRYARNTLDYTQFLLPRLLASISAAWLSIALGEDLFKAFFDLKLNMVSAGLLALATFIFVAHEVDKIVPYVEIKYKFFRALQLMLISFTMSLMVGLIAINFTGELFLERSGYLPEFYRDNIMVSSITNDKERHLDINFREAIMDPALSDAEVMNTYTLSPVSTKDSLNDISAKHAIKFLAETPYDMGYTTRISELNSAIDSIKSQGTNIALSDTTRGRFLLRHGNQKLFKDLLEYVEHHRDGHSVAQFITPPFSKQYRFFVLHDFLIQFSVVAMFIGIFIQMIFEGKNITE